MPLRLGARGLAGMGRVSDSGKSPLTKLLEQLPQFPVHLYFLQRKQA